MQALCTLCGSEMNIPYWMLGASCQCSRCNRVMVPSPKQHVPIPPTGYEITFSSFVHLLTHSHSRQQALQIAGAWASELEQLTSVGGPLAPASATEKALLAIHRDIQSKPGVQGNLYQFAMSLWR